MQDVTQWFMDAASREILITHEDLTVTDGHAELTSSEMCKEPELGLLDAMNALQVGSLSQSSLISRFWTPKWTLELPAPVHLLICSILQHDFYLKKYAGSWIA